MQFTVSTVALVASLMTSEVTGNPIFELRGQTCGSAPAGSSAAQPLSSPQVSTAEGCKAAGEAVTSCQSFAFGLPPKATTPVCKLFSVPAVRVPAQASNVVVFDLSCSNVPTKAPTTSNPVGLLRRSQVCGATPSYSGSATPLSTPSASTAEECKVAGAAVSTCKSFAFGLPTDASTPICHLFSVSAAQVPTQAKNVVVFDIGCSDIPNTQPTQENPVGLVDEVSTTVFVRTTGKSNTNNDKPSTSNTSNKSDKTSNSNTNTGSDTTVTSNTSKNMCGSTPTGSTGAALSPLKTSTAVSSADACLTLGKATSGCMSIEFGKTSSNGANQCVLFSVAASKIPAATNGQSFVVYDIGC